jgi:hypothetical protein
MKDESRSPAARFILHFHRSAFFLSLNVREGTSEYKDLLRGARLRLYR